VILWLTTFAIGIASALVPFLPIEVYILGAGATEEGAATAISLGIAAGIGATIGKIIWYEVARRGVESRWMQRKLSKPKSRAAYEKWSARMGDRPWYSGGIMFVSSLTGLPPLLVMGAVAGALRMPLWLFVPTVLVGRCVRFALLFLGVDIAVH
jgi:membrane protein YqaA with SNARE-associated domain